MSTDEATTTVEQAPTPSRQSSLRGCPVHLGDDFGNNPYPVYEEFRGTEPVQPVILRDGTEAYLLTRYEDVRTCFNDLRLSNRLDDAPKPNPPGGADAAPPVGGLVLRRDEVSRHMMINQDPPDHTRLRKLVTRSFSAKRVMALEPQIRRIAVETIAGFADRGRVDLIAEYAKPMPTASQSALLGVPQERRRAFIDGIDTLTGGRSTAAAQDALNGLKALLADELEKKRTNPQEDLLTDLLEAAEEEGRMEPIELLASAVQVMLAVYFGPLSALGNAIHWLLRMPEKRAVLMNDRSRILPAVHELLRFDGPQAPGSVRYATVDIEVAGQTIPKGSLVLLSTSASNRDPEMFPDPNMLDFDRPNSSKHIGFGNGIHYCLGSRLAPVLLAISIEELFAAFPDMRLAVAPEELHWSLRTPFRGLDSLPVFLH